MNNNRLYKLVSQIPAGSVTTYGVLGKATGLHPRTVGQLLHKNPDPATIPCHRVVNSKGKLSANFAFGSLAGQARKLEAEGVEIKVDRVSLDRFGWLPIRLDAN